MMIPKLDVGNITIQWLNGGEMFLDGGTMFGSVPKLLWSKKYPADNDNYIKLLNSALLITTPDARIVVETGFGNKLTEKQKKIFRVCRDWSLPGDLQSLGLERGDIDFVILTHCDFDHAGGIVMHGGDNPAELTFPKARHIIQQQEWEDVLNPNIRAAHTYWPVNFEGLADSGNLELLSGDKEIVPGVSVLLTGGHTRGHQVVSIESAGERAYHLADLLPTHVHFNPLWIMAYDNFPLDVIAQKEKLINTGISSDAWFTYYHDPFLRACRFSEKGDILSRL